MTSRTRPRVAATAIFAVVLLVVGQLAALAHNAEAKHVTCSEHGEQLEAATLADELHACEHDHFVGVEGELGGEHDECALSRALRQHSIAVAAPDAAFIQVDLRHDVERAPLVCVAAAPLYLIAPKTSPPRQP